MIYLIGNREQGVCKIGFTTASVEKRLKTLQTGNPHQLFVFGKIEGTVAQERALHAKYAGLRLAGEWFTLSKEIAAEFAFDKDAPDRLWAVALRFKKNDEVSTIFTDSLMTVFAPSSPEAITEARSKTKVDCGRCISAMASPIPYDSIIAAYGLLPAAT